MDGNVLSLTARLTMTSSILPSPHHVLCQGIVVTCMSCIETFATGIKIESSKQGCFLKADQGIKVTSELQNRRSMNAWLQLDF